MPVAAAAIGLAGTIGSAVIGAGAAKKAAKAEAKAAAAASAERTKMYEQLRTDLAPYRGIGEGAGKELTSLYGLDGSDPMNSKALEAFKMSPDFKVSFDAGVKTVNQNDAARGSLLSGDHYKRLSDYASDHASMKFNSYVDKLYKLAGLGQSSAAQTGSAAMSTGEGVASDTIRAGEAKASGIAAQGNIIGSAIGSIADAGSYLAQRYGSSFTPATTSLYG